MHFVSFLSFEQLHYSMFYYFIYTNEHELVVCRKIRLQPNRMPSTMYSRIHKQATPFCTNMNANHTCMCGWTRVLFFSDAFTNDLIIFFSFSAIEWLNCFEGCAFIIIIIDAKCFSIDWMLLWASEREIFLMEEKNAEKIKKNHKMRKIEPSAHWIEYTNFGGILISPIRNHTKRTKINELNWNKSN